MMTILTELLLCARWTVDHGDSPVERTGARWYCVFGTRMWVRPVQ
jgi:hypothetical protein